MVAREAAPAAGQVALVAGATGLVGREVLAALLADNRYAQVHCVGRRAPPVQHAKLRIHLVERLDEKMLSACKAPAHVDHLYIALGTTIKVAGSKEAFRALDHDAVLAVARFGRTRGATALGVVSAMGADPRSGVFYNRVKGETERDLEQLGYALLVIARPSVLTGDRSTLGQPARAGESLALAAMRWLTHLTPANYRPIPAGTVARALVARLARGGAGKQLVLSGALQD